MLHPNCLFKKEPKHLHPPNLKKHIYPHSPMQNLWNVCVPFQPRPQPMLPSGHTPRPSSNKLVIIIVAQTKVEFAKNKNPDPGKSKSFA